MDKWTRGVFCRGGSADRGLMHLCLKGHTGQDLDCPEWCVVPRGEKHPIAGGPGEDRCRVASGRGAFCLCRSAVAEMHGKMAEIGTGRLPMALRPRARTTQFHPDGQVRAKVFPAFVAEAATKTSRSLLDRLLRTFLRRCHQ